MSNDAKLGLVVGVGLVIVVAVVFFRKDLGPLDGDVTVTTSGPASKAVQAQPTGLQSTHEGIRHTVRAGETLDSLAQQYYGDSERAAQIYEANRGQLGTPGVLPEGAELYIPEPAQTAWARP